MTPPADRPRRHRGLLRGALAALALAGLAACGGAGGREDTGAAAEQPTVAAIPMPAATATAHPATAEPVAAPTPAPVVERYPEPATLRGLDEGQLSRLLGAPRFKRRDDPAQIWQYGDDACVLDVFLYKAGKGGAYRVRYFETRGRDHEPVDQAACFVGLLKARDRGAAG